MDGSDSELEKAAHDKGLELIQENEALKAGELVPVCTVMRKLSELTDYRGYYGSDDVVPVLDADGVFRQFADTLLYMVVGEESKLKSRSAIA